MQGQCIDVSHMQLHGCMQRLALILRPMSSHFLSDVYGSDIHKSLGINLEQYK